jgi:type IV secretory pathway VirB10-like protein
VSCSRPAGLQNDEAAAHADQQQVPFHDGAGPAVAGPGEVETSADNRQNPSEPGLPFHDAQNLPAGTLITVRLQNSISSENPGDNSSFEAVVDEPIEVAGKRLVPRGTKVSGQIESARASNVSRDHGYLRLVLRSLDLAGVKLPIQTSSLFVRGNAGMAQVRQAKAPTGDNSAAVIRIEKERRLIFRLTEPVYLVVRGS